MKAVLQLIWFYPSSFLFSLLCLPNSFSRLVARKSRLHPVAAFFADARHRQISARKKAASLLMYFLICRRKNASATSSAGKTI